MNAMAVGFSIHHNHTPFHTANLKIRARSYKRQEGHGMNPRTYFLPFTFDQPLQIDLKGAIHDVLTVSV